LVSYARYLGKAIWPADLCVFYPHPGAWPEGQVAGSAALLLGLTLLVLWKMRRAPYAPVGWFWFLGVLVPYIGLVDAGTVELIRSFGKDIVSSGDLVARFEAAWSDEQIDTHFAARDMVVSVPHPGLDHETRVAGVAIKMSETPGRVRHRAPLLVVRSLFEAAQAAATSKAALIEAMIGKGHEALEEPEALEPVLGKMGPCDNVIEIREMAGYA